jgi:hypothetical protein
VTVPISLIALGNESAMTFSLSFDTNVLTYVGIASSSGAAIDTLNIRQAASGQIGLLMSSVGDSFAPGAQVLANVTFAAALATTPVQTTISFGDSPARRGISDINYNPLAGVEYLAGTVTVTPTSLEGDVSPRPNGDYAIGANDWLQEGRFVAGLDTISNTAEFQRADCAPRGTAGDGVIDAADLAQVGRYAVGLDPLTAMGGPTGAQQLSGVVKFQGMHPMGGVSRTLSLVPVTNIANCVLVELAAQGDENTLAFSVSFDPTVLSFASARQVAVASGAQFRVNTNKVATGALGIVLALPGGQSLAAGTDPVVQLMFNPVAGSNLATLAFTNSPISCSVADVTASDVSANYQSGSLVVGGATQPLLGIGPAANGVTLTWPSTAGGFVVQMTTNLSAAWSDISATAVTNGVGVSVSLPAPAGTTFYRLRPQ